MTPLTPLTPTSVRHLEELIRWADGFMSEPYAGPGAPRPGGPICPFTRQAVADDDLLVDLHRGFDGSDEEEIRRFIDASCRWFTDNLPRDAWRKALVIGLPDMSHQAGPAFEDVMLATSSSRMAQRILGAVMYEDRPDLDGTEPWPVGIRAPMPALVLRYVSRLDFRFLNDAPAVLEAYLDSYGADYAAGSLPAVARRGVEEACRIHGMSPPGGS